jgi:hypothetical protein
VTSQDADRPDRQGLDLETQNGASGQHGCVYSRMGRLADAETYMLRAWRKWFTIFPRFTENAWVSFMQAGR